ncbi:hypothetical protein RCZ04_13770 [Capnocytophaga sp. HP1101]
MDNQANEEKIFFQQNNVLVSQSRLVIGDKTYVLGNISSVSVASDFWIKKPNKGLYKFILTIALVLFFWQIRFIDVNSSVTTYFMLFVYIALIIFALRKMSKLKPEYFYNYYVRISSNSGTSDVLDSPDQQYIQKIVDALNQAIIYRG